MFLTLIRNKIYLVSSGKSSITEIVIVPFVTFLMNLMSKISTEMCSRAYVSAMQAIYGFHRNRDYSENMVKFTSSSNLKGNKTTSGNYKPITPVVIISKIMK